jgi:hypothetical protein
VFLWFYSAVFGQATGAFRHNKPGIVTTPGGVLDTGDKTIYKSHLKYLSIHFPHINNDGSFQVYIEFSKDLGEFFVPRIKMVLTSISQ